MRISLSTATPPTRGHRVQYIMMNMSAGWPGHGSACWRCRLHVILITGKNTRASPAILIKAFFHLPLRRRTLITSSLTPPDVVLNQNNPYRNVCKDTVLVKSIQIEKLPHGLKTQKPLFIINELGSRVHTSHKSCYRYNIKTIIITICSDRPYQTLQISIKTYWDGLAKALTIDF